MLPGLNDFDGGESITRAFGSGPHQIHQIHYVTRHVNNRYINMALLCREMAVVRYIGHTDFAPGIWIGLELKNPKGNELLLC
jgi:hypothetical protein